jgi:hypothetical protein
MNNDNEYRIYFDEALRRFPDPTVFQKLVSLNFFGPVAQQITTPASGHPTSQRPFLRRDKFEEGLAELTRFAASVR